MTREISERFWEKVDRSGECWLWRAYCGVGGYGVFLVGSRIDGSRRLRPAHHISYELEIGPIPIGSHIHHVCGVRACVRPDHLEALSPRDHMLRHDGPLAENARLTHCRKCGRPLEGENLIVETGRRCKACRYAYMAALKRKLRRERSPWLPSARNYSDAGRTLSLASAAKRRKGG